MTRLANNSFVHEATVLAVLAVLFFVWGNAPALWRRFRFRGSSNWPIIEGTVDRVLAHRSALSDGSGPNYRTEIAYWYHFQGTYYSGYYVCDLCTTEAGAEELAERYPKGTTLQLHVNPENPKLSALCIDP